MQHLTDPQYKAMAAAIERGDNEILRGEDATVSTLRSLARKHLVALEYQTSGLRKVIVSGRITRGGLNAWHLEHGRRQGQLAASFRGHGAAYAQDNGPGLAPAREREILADITATLTAANAQVEQSKRSVFADVDPFTLVEDRKAARLEAQLAAFAA